LKICNSTRLKNSVTSIQSLSFKTTDLCCIISIFDYKLLELFEMLRSRPTLVVHRSRYSCAMCTQNHMFVREKSSSVQPFTFPEVCGASGTNIWERDWRFGTYTRMFRHANIRFGIGLQSYVLVQKHLFCHLK
jgi:hypothetical protein